MRWYSDRSIEEKRVVWAWSFLALPILFFCVVRFWPTLEAFYVSFHSPGS